MPVFHDAENYHFEIGKGEQITEGGDIAIIATGLMVNEARIAAEQLAAEGIPVSYTHLSHEGIWQPDPVGG